MLAKCLQPTRRRLVQAQPSFHICSNRSLAWTGRSSSFSTSSQWNEVALPCRNGSITLNIQHPLIATDTPKIILYLPPGPVVARAPSRRDEEIVSALSASTHATIVRINYRLSRKQPYPLPVHDVLAGYDWVIENLASRASEAHNGRRQSAPRIGVCGELVGGGLATMLALTECRLGQRARISAVAANNPIVDWVFPDDSDAAGGSDLTVPNTQEWDGHEDVSHPPFGLHEPYAPLDEISRALDGLDIADDQPPPTDLPSVPTLPPAGDGPQAITTPKRKSATKAGPSSFITTGPSTALPASALYRARSTLFRTPSAYFDPFASPIHFFRTPSREVPQPPGELSEWQELLASLDPHPQTSPGGSETRRKSPRSWPPAGSGLCIPKMRISIGSGNPLADQGRELVHLARRAVARNYTRTRKGDLDLGRVRDLVDKGREVDDPLREVMEEAESEAERRVRGWMKEGTGLWCVDEKGGDVDGWRHNVREVGDWLANVLR